MIVEERQVEATVSIMSTSVENAKVLVIPKIVDVFWEDGGWQSQIRNTVSWVEYCDVYLETRRFCVNGIPFTVYPDGHLVYART